MRKGTLKKALALALTGAVLVGAFAGCGAKKDSSDKKETKKIVIGASPSPHADILKVAKKELKKEGYELEIKEYSDYVQPNTASFPRRRRKNSRRKNGHRQTKRNTYFTKS